MDIEDEKLNKMLADLLQEAELNRKVKSAVQEFIIIIMCVNLLEGTKNKPELYKAARKKVISTLEQTEIYKSYINRPAIAN